MTPQKPQNEAGFTDPSTPGSKGRDPATSRGFLVLFYAKPWNQLQRWEWVQMLLLSCESFRAHNRTSDLLVLDVDRTLTTEELLQLRRCARVHIGPTSARDNSQVSWTHSNLDKSLALVSSPFDHTALFDLDIVWTGTAEDIWDTGHADLTLGYYDQYTGGDLWPHINSGVTICRNRDAAIRAQSFRLQQAARFKGWAAQADEILLREAWQGGAFSVDLMPAGLWGMDWKAFFFPETHLLKGVLCTWPGPLMEDWTAPIDKVFRLGNHLYPRGFHFTSVRHRVLTCPRMARYRGMLHASRLSY